MKKYYGAFSFAWMDWLDQQRWDSELVQRGEYIIFENIRGVDNTRITYRDKEIKTITIIYEDDYPNLLFTINLAYTDGTDEDLSDDGSEIFWQEEMERYSNIGLSAKLCYADFVSYPNNFDDIWKYNIADTYNIIYLFRLNSPKIKVDKDITLVGCMPIKFNNVIKYRDMEITMKWGINDDKFNYVYISSLKRYYFVTDKVLTNDIAVLQLHEDVASSFANLIRNQTAQVERNENTYHSDLIDSRRITENGEDITVVEDSTSTKFFENSYNPDLASWGTTTIKPSERYYVVTYFEG